MSDLRDRCQVYIRDTSLHIVAQIDDWVKVDCTPTFNDVGAWIVDVPYYSLPQLSEGCGFIINRNDELVIAGPYTQIIPSKNKDAPAGSLEVSGVSDNVYIRDRLVYPTPSAPSTSQAAAAYYAATGLAELVVKNLVNLNVGPGAYSSGLDVRPQPGLVVAPDTGLGSTVTANFRFDNLMDAVNSLLLHDSLGWSVTWTNGLLTFDVYQPRDLSGSIRLTWDGGGLPDQAFTLTAPLGTREVVAGSGVGTARVFHERSDAAAESTWQRRVERFNDRRDTADSATLDQAGDEALLADAATTQLSTSVTDTEAIQYGRDYHLGDKVAIVADITELDDIVRSVHYTIDETGEAVVPTVGNTTASAAPATSVLLKTIIKQLGLQQRRV